MVCKQYHISSAGNTQQKHHPALSMHSYVCNNQDDRLNIVAWVLHVSVTSLGLPGWLA